MTSAGEALAVLRGLVLDNGRTWGAAALPFQREDAQAVLDCAGASMAFLTRARGASKTVDLAGMLVAVLLEQAPPGSRSYAIAADEDQAGLLVDAIRGFVARTAGLAQLLRVEAKRVTVLASGATLEALAADGPSTYGLRPYFVVVDELAQWRSTREARAVWTAIISAMAKDQAARLVLLTTAGAPSHWSYRILQHARTSPRWHVREVPGPSPWATAEALEEQRALLTESEFARLHLNEWTAAEDRLVAPDDLAACVVLDGTQPFQPFQSYVVAVDLATRHDNAVVAVCHSEPLRDSEDGPAGPVAGPLRGLRVIVDRVEVWTPTSGRPVQLSDVEAFLAECAPAYGGAPVIFDPFQAIGMMERLRARGIRTVEYTFTQRSVGVLGNTLYQLLRARTIALPDDAALLEELANVRLRSTAPGIFRMDHDADKHDDRAVAIALAAQHLVGLGASSGGTVQVVLLGDDGFGGYDGWQDFDSFEVNY